MRPTAGRQLGVNWATSGWRLDWQRCHTIGPRSARRGCRVRTPSSSRQRPVRLRNSTTRARLETIVPLMTGRAAATKSEPGRHEPASKKCADRDSLTARRLHHQRTKRSSKEPGAPDNGCRAAVMVFRGEPSEPAGKGPRGRRCR